MEQSHISANSHATPLVGLEAVVLDTETTGLDARSARILQIGALRINGPGGDALDTFERLVNPGMPVPAQSTQVHGISNEMVAGAPAYADIADALEAFVGHSAVIGHSIAFDMEMLSRESRLAGRYWRPPRTLDTRILAKIAAPSLADHSLDRLCSWLDIEIEGRHTAMGDAAATAKVFLALIPLLRERNVRTLAEAEAESRRVLEVEARTAGGLAEPVDARNAADTRPLVRIDSFPYRHRVRDVMSVPPVFADPAAPLSQVLATLMARGISSVYVRPAAGDEAGETGIATERDLLRALGEHGAAALDLPVSGIAKRPLQTVAEDDFVYRAIGRMERLGFRHLGVHDPQGEIVGALTTRNLLRHRATTAIVLGDEIDSATTATTLAQAWARLGLMARSLVDEDVDPRQVAAVISTEIQMLTRRCAELAEARMIEAGQGAPPVPYAVIVLGSAGRGESLLAADQDNAIVYEQGDEGGPADRYFETLATHMCAMLDEVGVPLCKGGVMAKNRAWRMSVADWKATVDAWVRRQRPQDLLNVDIFFDSIPVHGDKRLGETIWHHAWDRGGSAPDFLKLLTEVARDRGSAFTFFGGLRTDEQGRIDLKKLGLMPIFTSARVLAIRHGVRERATLQRLAGVAANGVGAQSDIEAVIEAHRVIMGAMLSQQLQDAEAGVPLSSKVDPGQLGKPAQRTLQNALRKVDTIVDIVSEGRL